MQSERLRASCRTTFGTAENGCILVGPGLELEVESERIGDFMSSVFLQTQAFYVTDRVNVRECGVRVEPQRGVHRPLERTLGLPGGRRVPTD